MERSIILTADGSHTISVPSLNATYHSVYGAIQESRHVYINAGLQHLIREINNNPLIRVFEMGFGTGLNALLSLLEAEKLFCSVEYTGIENDPLPQGEVLLLNYGSILGGNSASYFQMLHEIPWNIKAPLSPHFIINKIETTLQNFETQELFDLIYYDAFAPGAQPELWTSGIFEKISGFMPPGGSLVTYCAKGEVRRSLAATGFKVEKLPGPQGKREMIRAVRIQ
jgi:tRNA U34 5-methylaminomethyl-2-thiouridine-forming methyltransferase MnmC